MKVLTLTQPWATLVAIGAKRIETRSWPSAYRGPLAIHAAKGFPADAAILCNQEPFKSVLKEAGYIATCQLPRGAILAVCQMADCLSMNGGRIGGPKYADWVHDLSDTERVFGNYGRDRFGFFLESVCKLPEPVPARGMLGMWTYDGVLEVKP